MRRALAIALLATAVATLVVELRERRRTRASHDPLLPRADAPAQRGGHVLAAGVLLWLVVSRAAAALTLTVLALLAVSYASGFRSMTVMSGSMEPAVGTGDMVVNRPIAPLDARVGDVVTFRDPDGGGRFITHRVRRVTAVGASVTLVTKGDANTGAERWTTPATGEIGRVEYRIPRLGYALFWTRGAHARLMLVTLPALLLGLLLLVQIWRPRTRERPHAAVA